MSEAFEIGISLALADGVSEGMAKAERDAAAARRAAGAGALAVQQLQQAGVAALSVMGSMTRMAKGGTQAEVARAVPSRVAPAAASGGSETAIAAMPYAEARSGAQEAASAVKPLAPTSAPERAGQTRQVLTDAYHPSTARPARLEILPGVRLDGDRAALAPLGAVPRTVSGTRGQGDTPAASARLPSDDVPFPTVSAGRQAAPVWSGRAAPFEARLRLDHYARSGAEAVAPATGERRPRDTQRPAVQAAAPETPAPAYPLAPVFVDRTQPDGKTQAGSAFGNSAAQMGGDVSGAGASGAAGATQGDVFLDGTLVGRWMSRHLSREAGRASAGPTAFDARRNALLPGATVGG